MNNNSGKMNAFVLMRHGGLDALEYKTDWPTPEPTGPEVLIKVSTYLRDLTFTGSTVIPPHVFADLVGYIEAGEVRPLLAATYPLAELHEAQQAFIAKKQIGNIVVIP